ncbi:S-layer homology domain-containing protein [Bacillus thermotolerans]|nr:S-layer homology domain-containing protein [Bacillus thermotolerans]
MVFKRVAAVSMSLMMLFPLAQPLNTEAASLNDEVQAMVDLGVMQGFEGGDLRPGQNVTRAEFATFLTRALHLPPGPSAFKDVPSTLTLAPGVNAAAAAGIVNGGSNGRFQPDALITRQDMALMISNAMEYLKMKVEYKPSGFADVEGLSSAHKIAIGQAYELGIIQGYSSTHFEPERYATRAHAAAFINRLLQVIKSTGTPLPEPPAATKPNGDLSKPFLVGDTDQSGRKSYVSSYRTFDEAKQAMDQQGHELVVKDGKVVYMKPNSGIVFADSKASTVTLYSDPTFTTLKAYMPTANGFNNEVKYITSTDQYVKVALGGKEYYMKPQDSLLVPFEGAPGRGYYSVRNGELYHSIYLYKEDRYVSYLAGPAPDFMQPGQKYYSWDNAVFYNDQGRVAGSAYQYFQFLSARTTSNYTVEELDRFINNALAERKATGLARYKDAPTKSKLVGLGSTLKKVEQEKQINALLILAMAIHESDYGMSRHAQINNNLFGIAVYDSRPEEGKSFPTPEASVHHLADGYLNDRYVIPNPAGAWKQTIANGAAAGNKGVGINVRYASDIDWGAKVAGHMYRIDKALGGKDFNKYKLGFTTVDDLNIRMQPNGAVQFSYREAGMPVALIGNPVSGWQKVFSDELRYTEGYVSSQYIQTIPIAK